MVPFWAWLGLVWFGLVWFETQHEKESGDEKTYGEEQNAEQLKQKKACLLISLEVLFLGFPFTFFLFCFSSRSFVKAELARRVGQRREKESVSGEVGCHIGSQQQEEPTTTTTTTTTKFEFDLTRFSCMSQNKICVPSGSSQACVP